MIRAADNRPEPGSTEHPPPLSAADAPKPTARFRRRAWLEFQRALDPLARRTSSLATPVARPRD